MTAQDNTPVPEAPPMTLDEFTAEFRALNVKMVASFREFIVEASALEPRTRHLPKPVVRAIVESLAAESENALSTLTNPFG